MKAVFERQDEKIATFVLDDLRETYTISRQNLPKDLRVGDVVEVKIENGKLIILRNLLEERKEREARIRKKREQLLKRSKK